jgi:hypothetical protein
MNWEDIIISILVGAAVLYLFKTLRKPKSNCGDNNCDCG